MGKPVNYVEAKASEKSYLEVVQPCMKTYMGEEWKSICTAITQNNQPKLPTGHTYIPDTNDTLKTCWTVEDGLPKATLSALSMLNATWRR